MGVGYVLFGVVGFFVTGFDPFITDTPEKLIGFDINPFHNIVHFGIGAYLLFVAQLSRPIVEGALIGGGAVYLVAAFLGFTGGLEIISINSAGAPINFLHIVTGSAALAIGLFSVATTPAAEGESSGVPGNVLKQRR